MGFVVDRWIVSHDTSLDVTAGEHPCTLDEYRNAPPPKRSPLHRRTPLASRSAKRRAEEAEYQAGRYTFLRDHPRCEIGLPCCTRWATEVHHKRGRRGKMLLRGGWPSVVPATRM